MAKNSEYTKWGKLLASIGAILAIIGCILSMDADIVVIVYNILGILVSLAILAQVGLIKKYKLQFVWWLLLIFVCAQAILMRYGGAFGEIGTLGVVLEAIAVILLILRDL